jgi:hypothetical protein
MPVIGSGQGATYPGMLPGIASKNPFGGDTTFDQTAIRMIFVLA